MLKDFIKSMRPTSAIYILEIIFGAIYSLNFNLEKLDLIKLIFICISFQLLYSGIYILNDIIDYNKDRLNKEKQDRPIASGKLKRKNAIIFSIFLIIFGFIGASLISRILIYFEIFFLLFNIFYSLIFKRIPYLGSIIGGITHAARFLIGMLLFGAFNEYYFIISIFLISSGYTFAKRLKEIEYNEKTSHPNEYYSRNKIRIIWMLYIFILIILIILSQGLQRILIMLLSIIFSLTIILYLTNKNFKSLFNNYFLKI